MHWFQKIFPEKYLIYYLMLLYVTLGMLSICIFNGTGDDGDSIAHFLFAKYAPVQPELYFDHWAKPVFVLLASPFAQFGFKAVKFFNLFVQIVTVYFTYRIAIKLNLKNAIVVDLLLFCSPLFYILSFSALTEPLFALFLALGLYLYLDQKQISATIVLSFLPYVRSEGLIILGVCFIYLFLKKQWRCIPLLGVGSVLYSIAGYFVYKDFFWVITKIPYAHMSSVYGHGSPFHFVEQLINVMGVPVYLLFWIGLICGIYFILKRKKSLELTVLVYLMFVVFFIAHSSFWYLGIFNSMGLKRVFLAIMPVMSIIALEGFNFITEDLCGLKIIFKKVGQFVFIGYVLIFPFTSNPSAVQWQKDMNLTEKQIRAKQTFEFLKIQNIEGKILWYNNFYLSMLLDRNHFDVKERRDLKKDALDLPKSDDIIIWDKRVEPEEIQLRDLNSNNDFQLIYAAQDAQQSGDTLYAVYKKK